MEQRPRQQQRPPEVASTIEEGAHEAEGLDEDPSVRSSAPTFQRSNASETFQRSNASSRPIIVNTHQVPERLRQMQGELAVLRRTHEGLEREYTLLQGSIAQVYQRLFAAEAPPAPQALVAIEGAIRELIASLQATQTQAASTLSDLQATNSAQEAMIQTLREAHTTTEEQLAAYRTEQTAQFGTLQALTEARDQALAREATLRQRLDLVRTTLALGEELPLAEAVRRFRTRVVTLARTARQLLQARNEWRTRAEAAEVQVSALRAALPETVRGKASPRPQPRQRPTTAGYPPTTRQGRSRSRREFHGKKG